MFSTTSGERTSSRCSLFNKTLRNNSVIPMGLDQGDDSRFFKVADLAPSHHQVDGLLGGRNRSTKPLSLAEIGPKPSLHGPRGQQEKGQGFVI
jgi:hypothetical protein